MCYLLRFYGVYNNMWQSTVVERTVNSYLYSRYLSSSFLSKGAKICWRRTKWNLLIKWNYYIVQKVMSAYVVSKKGSYDIAEVSYTSELCYKKYISYNLIIYWLCLLRGDLMPSRFSRIVSLRWIDFMSGLSLSRLMFFITVYTLFYKRSNTYFFMSALIMLCDWGIDTHIIFYFSIHPFEVSLVLREHSSASRLYMRERKRR